MSTWKQLKLLNVYGSQNLFHVENLTIKYGNITDDWDFIRLMAKLRHIDLYVVLSTSGQAAKTLSTLRERNNNGSLGWKGDFIDIKFNNQNAFEIFGEINGPNECIESMILPMTIFFKLSLLHFHPKNSIEMKNVPLFWLITFYLWIESRVRITNQFEINHPPISVLCTLTKWAPNTRQFCEYSFRMIFLIYKQNYFLWFKIFFMLWALDI